MPKGEKRCHTLQLCASLPQLLARRIEIFEALRHLPFHDGRGGVFYGTARWKAGLGAYGFFYGNALAHLGPVAVCTAYYLSGKWITFNLLERQGKRQKA